MSTARARRSENNYSNGLKGNREKQIDAIELDLMPSIQNTDAASAFANDINNMRARLRLFTEHNNDLSLAWIDSHIKELKDKISLEIALQNICKQINQLCPSHHKDVLAARIAKVQHDLIARSPKLQHIDDEIITLRNEISKHLDREAVTAHVATKASKKPTNNASEKTPSFSLFSLFCCHSGDSDDERKPLLARENPSIQHS